jgi:hypothetical protein
MHVYMIRPHTTNTVVLSARGFSPPRLAMRTSACLALVHSKPSLAIMPSLSHTVLEGGDITPAFDKLKGTELAMATHTARERRSGSHHGNLIDKFALLQKKRATAAQNRDLLHSIGARLMFCPTAIRQYTYMQPAECAAARAHCLVAPSCPPTSHSHPTSPIPVTSFPLTDPAPVLLVEPGLCTRSALLPVSTRQMPSP